MSEVSPQTPSLSEPLKLVVVDQSKDAYEAARDQADARLSVELSEGNGFKRFMNGIWKGNIAKEYYRQQYIHKAVDDIESSQDVLSQTAGLDNASRSRAMNATIERFQSEHDEMVHEDAGEKKEFQQQDSEISGAFKDMIRRYAEGDLNDTTLREERTRFMQVYRETHDDESFGRGIVTTDNMMEIARAVVGAVEHGESMDAVIANMQVITGEARDGVRTEARYNKIDRAIDKLSKTKIGSMVGPEIIISAVTLAAMAAKWGSHSVVGAALKTIAPGAGAGIWAGLRENKRVKDERSQHAREVAMGKEFSADSKRRTEMEATRYESRSAQDLTDFVRTAGNSETLEAGGNEAVQAALDSLAQVQSRIDLSNKRKIDLISYSDAAAIGDERMALDLARAEVRVALEGHLTVEVRTQLGLDVEASVADMIARQSTQYIELIDQDISSKDRAFRSLKARRIAKAAAIGVATGIVGGLIAQEFVASIDPTRAGLFEQAWGAHNEVSSDGLQHQTLLEGIVHGDQRVLHTGASHHFEHYSTAEKSLGSLNLSDDHELVRNPDGTVNFVDPNGHATINHLAMNKDGSLPRESLDRLKAAGMKVEDHSFNKEITTTSTTQVSSEQFVQNHLSETTHAQRDLWYANDTPHIYDKNELGLHWGGSSGLVDGGYQLSVAGMKPGGSYEGGQSVDWHQASEQGNLFVSISASADTQTQTFMVPISPDGTIHMTADSPAGHFFANVDGHAQFTGAYAEVVQTTGIDADGTVHMRPLATLVGEGGHNPVADTITTTTTEHHAVYSVTTEGYDTTVQNYTEAAPILPIESRRSLEAAQRSRRPGYGYGESEYLTPSEIAQLRKETSPRLRRNPDAILNPKQELDWYSKQLRKNEGNTYIDEIQRSIHASPELQAPSPNLKAVIAIPVGAVGEADNIYKTLSLYAQQDPATISETKFLLHINWKDSAESNPVEAAAIAKTQSEIERARRDFPGLSIATIQSVWSEERYQRGEYGQGLIGHVARKLYDTAMLSVQEQMANGTIPADRDVLLIRNDADAQGMDRHYVERMIQSAEKNPESDVFSGAVRWDTARHRDLPGFGFVANLNEIADIAAHRKDATVSTKTVGINMAVKMAVFAAVGGIGHGVYTGAGSDDLEVGKRVTNARGNTYSTPQRYARRIARRNRYTQRGTSPAIARKVHRIVAGGGIDSKGDRMERSYLSPGGVAETWKNFDQGGALNRSDGLDGLDRKEDMTTKEGQAAVIKRIEMNISGTMNDGWHSSIDSVEMRTALAVMLPIELNNHSVYTMRNIRKRNGKTEVEFKFSADGAKWLINHLRRDARGRMDPYGSRVRRQLYSENTAKRKSVSAQPRFVQ